MTRSMATQWKSHPQSSPMDHPLSSNPAIWFCARMWNCENSKTIEFHQSIWLNTLSAKKYRSSEKSFENEVSLKPQPFPPWHFSFVIFHWRCCIDRNVFHLGCVVFAMHFNGMHLYRLSIWRRCIWWCISIGCNGDVFQGDALEDAIEGMHWLRPWDGRRWFISRNTNVPVLQPLSAASLEFLLVFVVVFL